MRHLNAAMHYPIGVSNEAKGVHYLPNRQVSYFVKLILI